MTQKIIFLFFLLIFQTAPIFAAPSDELHIEGISYEASNEAASIVVVNGEFLKKGDNFRHFKILEIGANFIRVADNQSGVESRVGITGGTPKTSSAPEAPKPSTPRTSVESPKVETNPSSANPLSSLLNPLSMINMANEVAIFAALKQISTAAQAYAQMEDSGDGGGVTLEQLIQRDMISDIYAKEYKGYRFSIQAKYDNIQTFADPVVDGPEQKHFLIDRHGIMRVEKGKSATDQSPPQNA